MQYLQIYILCICLINCISASLVLDGYTDFGRHRFHGGLGLNGLILITDELSLLRTKSLTWLGFLFCRHIHVHVVLLLCLSVALQRCSMVRHQQRNRSDQFELVPPNSGNKPSLSSSGHTARVVLCEHVCAVTSFRGFFMLVQYKSFSTCCGGRGAF